MVLIVTRFTDWILFSINSRHHVGQVVHLNGSCRVSKFTNVVHFDVFRSIANRASTV